MIEHITLTDNGYYNIAPGKLATTVTFLEMLAKPDITHKPARLEVELRPWPSVDIMSYRSLYRHVGEEWLWCSRLLMSEEDLSVIVNHKDVDVYAVMHGGKPCGLLELDYRELPACELAFFGLGSGLIGQGIGGWLMRQAIEIAWSREIERLWVHTCTLDHSTALSFYESFGFKPFKRQIEVMDDPRLNGSLPQHVAPHIPIIKNHKIRA